MRLSVYYHLRSIAYVKYEQPTIRIGDKVSVTEYISILPIRYSQDACACNVLVHCARGVVLERKNFSTFL